MQITSGLLSSAKTLSLSSFGRILLALKYKISKHLLLLFELSPSTQTVELTGLKKKFELTAETDTELQRRNAETEC